MANYNLGTSAGNYRHGLCGRPIYRAWCNMINRCDSKSRTDYQYYGGRGIKVCKALRDSVVNLNTLIGRPPKCFSLNRIDNAKNYSCGECSECVDNGWIMNVEWTSQKHQMRNTRYNRLLTLHGKTHCIVEWSEILGIPKDTIRARLNYGYSDKDALYTGSYDNRGNAK